MTVAPKSLSKEQILESKAVYKENRMEVVEDKEHSFDFEADAEETYGQDFDEMADFLILRLK